MGLEKNHLPSASSSWSISSTDDTEVGDGGVYLHFGDGDLVGG